MCLKFSGNDRKLPETNTDSGNRYFPNENESIPNASKLRKTSILKYEIASFHTLSFAFCNCFSISQCYFNVLYDAQSNKQID